MVMPGSRIHCWEGHVLLVGGVFPYVVLLRVVDGSCCLRSSRRSWHVILVGDVSPCVLLLRVADGSRCFCSYTILGKWAFGALMFGMTAYSLGG